MYYSLAGLSECRVCITVPGRCDALVHSARRYKTFRNFYNCFWYAYISFSSDCMCVYVCVYTYMYRWTHFYICFVMHTLTFHFNVCLCMYVCPYSIYIHTYSVYICERMYVYTYMHLYIHAHIHCIEKSMYVHL